MKIKKNIAVSETGFVFDPTTGDSYSLNPVGLKILNMLKEEKNKDDILKVFTQQYEIDDAGFEKYFFDFVGMLKHFDLIEEDEN